MLGNADRRVLVFAGDVTGAPKQTELYEGGADPKRTPPRLGVSSYCDQIVLVAQMDLHAHPKMNQNRFHNRVF